MQALNQLPVWTEVSQTPNATFHDLIIADKSILQQKEALTTTILSYKDGVSAYIQTFQPFASLWQTDLATVYAAFIAKNPQLEVAYSSMPFISS